MTTFSEMGLLPPLAEAIAARGYEKPTVVQAAVVNEQHAGRDLLVSSETGSGKTLAFGLALGPALLEATPNKGSGPSRPRALIIAPTRELATQVRNELSWLFGKTRLRIAVFTGGTDVRGDLKQLRPGVDVVVGTPGRLVDLLTRKNLDLDGVRMVVLDEADEMLDMGFREDLETLLGARATAETPEERPRTLMFSATLPATILSLAARYQHQAVRIDARTVKSNAGSHQDISYVAHLIAMGEKVPAVVNVLRRHQGVRAIVFGTTREGVAELHQQLLRRGFRAVVLSGDRAQSERTRALSALRDGQADLLVATNVAARGLDLPEVDLVVHADLPLNTEALTHRSGRTGRAGRKGTSVLIATLAERRKAERLLSFARVPFTWTAAPSASDIARAAQETLVTTLLQAPEDGDTATADEAAQALAAQLGAQTDRDTLLVKLLQRELARLPGGEPLTAVDLRSHGAPGRRDAGPPPSRNDFSRNAVRFRVNLGAEQKAEPGWLLPLICRRGGITRREVGAIRVGPTFSEFEIADNAAADFALAASQGDPRAPHVHIQRISPEAAPAARGGETPHARPSAPHRPHHRGAPPRPNTARAGGETPHARHPAPARPHHPNAERPTTARAAGGETPQLRPAAPHRPHHPNTERPTTARATGGHTPWKGKPYAKGHGPGKDHGKEKPPHKPHAGKAKKPWRPGSGPKRPATSGS